MDVYAWVLRVLHVVTGVWWAGATWTLAGFLTPAVQEIGKPGQEIMKELIQKRRLSEYIGIAGAISVITGLLLYWRASNGLHPTWILSGRGLSLSIGGLAGIATLGIGFRVIRTSALRMGELGRQIEQSEGPPDPEVLQEMQGLQAKLESGGLWAAALLAVSVIGMAGAQNLFF